MTLAWPLRPNWKASYSVSYRFSTDIFTSRSGREQRRALVDAPRKSLEFTCTAGGGRFRTLMALLGRQVGELIAMGEVTRKALTPAGYALGSTSVTIDTVPPWLVADELVVVWDGDVAEAREIDSVAGSVVTFKEPATMAAGPGAWVTHGLLGRLNNSLKFSALTTAVANGRVQFDVEPSSELPTMPPAAPATWNGRELFLERPNWATAREITVDRDIETVDYGRARIATYLPVAFASQVRTSEYLALNSAAAQRLIDFFLRMRGRQGEFYVPSDEQHMSLAMPAFSAASTLYVEGPELAAAYSGDPVHKAISVLMVNGDRFYRTVTGLVADGPHTRVQLGNGIPTTMASANVAAISWLPVCRFASDELTLEWLTDQVAQTRLSFRTLEALPPESNDDL